MTSREEEKERAARRALELVRPGMLLGLGTGSTADHFIRGLEGLVKAGMALRGVASSVRSARLAASVGVELVEDFEGAIDLGVDGADEIDARLNLIKGRGGALFREKLLAISCERYVIVADASKRVKRLGEGVLPVEVVPFLWRRTARALEALGAGCAVRGGADSPYLTDNHNLILDLTFPEGIGDPDGLGREIHKIGGVIEHGLFVGLASGCIVAGEATIEVMGSL